MEVPFVGSNSVLGSVCTLSLTEAAALFISLVSLLTQVQWPRAGSRVPTRWPYPTGDTCMTWPRLMGTRERAFSLAALGLAPSRSPPGPNTVHRLEGPTICFCSLGLFMTSLLLCSSLLVWFYDWFLSAFNCILLNVLFCKLSCASLGGGM